MLHPFQAGGCLFQISVWSTAMSFKCTNNPNKMSSDISPLVQRLTLKMTQKFCERAALFDNLGKSKKTVWHIILMVFVPHRFATKLCYYCYPFSKVPLNVTGFGCYSLFYSCSSPKIIGKSTVYSRHTYDVPAILRL